MDWTKAKNILIIAMLLTNCILGGLYYFQYVENEVPLESEIEGTIEQLESHQIYVDTEIPEKTRKMPVLFVEYDEMNEGMVDHILSNQQASDRVPMTERSVKALCDDVLKRCELMEETLVYESCSFDKDGADVIYKNIYNGIPIEESGIRCRVENGTIISIDRQWLAPVGYGKTKQKVVQSTDALIQFMSDWVNKQESGEYDELPDVHIERIDLVYWLDVSLGPSDGVEDTALPAWRITYNGGKVTFIDAYDQQ